ncbi:MAG: ABC transporter ATP-binding protein [Parvibaculaceae bacterium]|nr:ABC transporter ATP-binding protein [Parvibaculaceae bacterium]
MSPNPRNDKRWRVQLPNVLRIVSAISPKRGVLTLACLTCAGMAEAIGIASLLPLFAIVSDAGGAHPKGLGGKVVAIAQHWGIHPDVNLFLLILIVGMALKAGLTLLAMRQVGHAAADVSMRMRLNLIDALLDARWGYYTRQPVGRLSNSFSTEASQAGEAYNAAAQYLSDIILVTAYLVVVTLISWQLALLSLGVALVMVLTLNRFLVVAKRTAKQQTALLKTMISQLTDVLSGIKPMKAMGRQARFSTLFRRDTAKINKAMRRQVFAKQANKALQEPILAVCLAIGIYAALVIWSLPPGEVLVMALLLAKTVLTIGKAQQDLQLVRINESGYLAIVEAIAEARAVRETSTGQTPPRFTQKIEFRAVSFSFGQTPVIDNASFVIPAGKVTALTGVSGSGKTTTVDILLGLHQADKGSVLIDGTPLDEIDLLAWRRTVGYVPQELMLFHESILANITLGQETFSREDVERALAQAGALDFVSQLPEGVETIVGEHGTRLSGGQRQRVAIARALIHRPQLLILDEATTALDPETEANIVHNLCDLTRTTGLTILAISHQPAWANAADHVIHLMDGHVVNEPSPVLRGRAQ